MTELIERGLSPGGRAAASRCDLVPGAVDEAGMPLQIAPSQGKVVEPELTHQLGISSPHLARSHAPLDAV